MNITYSYTSNNRRVELRFERDLEMLDGQYVIATLFVNGVYRDVFEGYTIAEAIEETEREYPNDIFFKMVLKAALVLSAPEPAPSHDTGVVYDQPSFPHDATIAKAYRAWFTAEGITENGLVNDYAYRFKARRKLARAAVRFILQEQN